MIRTAQPLALTEIQPTPTPVATEEIHAPFEQQGNGPVVGEDGVGEQNVLCLQAVQHLPQESRLAGPLAVIGCRGDVQDGAAREANQPHQTQDGKAQALLLSGLLWIRLLIRRGVRHAHRAAVSDLEGSSP